MIVQTAPDGAPRLVIPMTQHLGLAGQFARAFGNDRFESPSPREEMMFIAEHHDDGWAEIDAAAAIDARTGFPYNLSETRFQVLVRTSVGSPDINSRRHAYCGLLSSMHSWGLFNGRYGLSDMVRLDSLVDDNRDEAEAMLAAELARQERLKAILADDPETRDWIAEDHLFQNYKQLQFFDTLALYFNRIHEGARKVAVFTHVPLSATEDVDVTVTPAGDGVYRAAPWPFAGDGLEATFGGHYMEPLGDAESVDLAAIPVDEQTVQLVAG